MATIQVDDLIDRAATIAQDQTGIRWPDAEWLNWLNDAQREVVLLKPQASVVNNAVQLSVGTKQTIPSDGVMLIDVVRNMGNNGTTPGRSIRITSREVLDAQIPDWHTAANAAGAIVHYMFDPRDPKTFYVYPPAIAVGDGSHYVELVYSASPTDCTIGGVIQIDDIYANSLLNLMLYRGYSKDAEYAKNAQFAAAYYQQAMSSLGVKSQSEMAQNPNLSVGAMNPNVMGAAKV
jgi:hypothetical protein